MATYYVGIGGNDANPGTSWATRKLTLDGAEDIPVAAGDTVYVGAGTYTGSLTCDVSGSSGSPITYIADVTGAFTDGIGGAVVISGTPDEQTASGSTAITVHPRDYRTFRGFVVRDWGGNAVVVNTASNWIFEDCVFFGNTAGISGGGGTNGIVRRCLFLSHYSYGAYFSNASVQSSSGHAFENCVFAWNVGGFARGLYTSNVPGITAKNCTFFSNYRGAQVNTDVANSLTITNSIFYLNTIAVAGVATGNLVEDYNSFNGNATTRANTNTGANSNTYLPGFAFPVLFDGVSILPNPYPGALADWSLLRAVTGSSASSEDLFGLDRPTTASKISRGALQWFPRARDTGTVRTGTASLKLGDMSRVQFTFAAGSVSTTVSVYVYWESDYAGTKPQLIVKQAGQTDQTDTAAGSAGAWEQLSITLTPAAVPGWIVVELVSNNTATSGNYDVFFDDLTVV